MRSFLGKRSSPVMLSAAKHLAADHDRPFAALRVTGCDSSHGQGVVFTIEPCLNFIIGSGSHPRISRMHLNLDNLYFFQIREIHAQALFTVLALELHIDEFCILHHLAFEDDAFSKLIVAHPVAWLELLALWFGRHRRYV